MFVQVGIIVVLVVAGVLVLRVGARAWQRLMARAGDTADTQPQPVRRTEPQGPVGPDGLVVLFGHEFADKASDGSRAGGISPRLRCYAPITDEELDPQHWAQQVLYATLASLYESRCIELQIVERAATLLPPYPQKTWELQVAQAGPMPESPISDVMAVAFDLVRRRRRVEPTAGERCWVGLDELIEQSLKTMRQEITFWQRSGVYGDIRQYVEAALIAQGYLIEPERPTWLDRVRHKRPRPDEEGVAQLEGEARRLAANLEAFRGKHGTGALEGETESEALRQVSPALLTPTEPLDQLPLDEALRISIYETLVSLRQLEPSGDAGV